MKNKLKGRRWRGKILNISMEKGYSESVIIPKSHFQMLLEIYGKKKKGRVKKGRVTKKKKKQQPSQIKKMKRVYFKRVKDPVNKQSKHLVLDYTSIHLDTQGEGSPNGTNEIGHFLTVIHNRVKPINWTQNGELIVNEKIYPKMSILRIVSALLGLKEKRGSGSEDKSDRTMEINVEGETKEVAIPMGMLEVYKELIKTLDAEEVGKIIDHVMSLGLQKMLGMVGQRGPTPSQGQVAERELEQLVEREAEQRQKEEIDKFFRNHDVRMLKN